MNQPHPAMSKRLLDDLTRSDFVQKPMPIHIEETREYRCESKPVLKNRLLSDMESLDGWEAITLKTDTEPYKENVARIELSKDRCIDGESSLKFTAPTNLPEWPGEWAGGIYCIPKAFFHVDHEDWNEYNQLSVWIYPDMPGFYNVCLRMQLHNTGEHVVPDVYDREGGHNINLVNQQWNHVIVEIPYTWRDNVIGVSFDYDMVGHENCAVDTACWYIDKLELQLVDPDLDEGWEVDKTKIAFSHAGYQPGACKSAIASVLTSDEFAIYDAASGDEVLRKSVETVTTVNGEYKVMNFTELTKEGSYYIVCGDKKTPPFAINDRVWMSSIWKVMNFFFCERCGYRVPNKHLICHTDSLVYHDGKFVVANGGWHDAGNMAQQVPLTGEATNAFFQLADEVRADDPVLYKRLLAEGAWGLEFLLKTRFGDGFRVTECGGSCWDDGIRGTADDIESEAENDAFTNLVASAAESAGYFALIDEDPELANYALRCAKEDLAFALEPIDAGTYDPSGIGFSHTRMSSKSMIAGAVAYAAMLIYRATGEQYYADKAAEYGNYIVKTQHTTYESDWSDPMIGFFYREDDHRNVVHYNHRSHEDKQNLGLIELCRQLPNHPDWMKWYSALLFHAKYTKDIIKYSRPYGMLPSGIYNDNEVEDLHTFTLMNPIGGIGGSYEAQLKATLENFQKQLDCAVRIGPHSYVRRFPVWFSFRGNTAVQLSAGKAVSATSIYLNDYDLYNIAQEQFQFVVGYNPFGQSTMFGEGYDYCQMYAVLPGEMVGELGVGMESNENHDAPFWPQLNNCTYKEVWVAAPAKWLWMMADEYMPARITASFPGEGGRTVHFRNKVTGAEYDFALQGGILTCELTAGQYEMSCGCQHRDLTVVAGGKYNIQTPLASFTAEKEVLDGNRIRITVKGIGHGTAELELRVRNLKADVLKKTVKLGCPDGICFECEVENAKEAWAAAIIPNGDMGEIIGIVG